MREHFQHLPIVGMHARFELDDPARASDDREMLQQQRADPAPLVIVEYRECYFRSMRIFQAQVSADADKALASILGDRRREADLIAEIEFGEALQILRRQ